MRAIRREGRRRIGQFAHRSDRDCDETPLFQVRAEGLALSARRQPRDGSSGIAGCPWNDAEIPNQQNRPDYAVVVRRPSGAR